MTTSNTPPALLTFEHCGLRLRSVVIDGNPWFVAKDVCDVLTLRVDNSIRGLDPDEKQNTTVEGFKRGATVISESGLYTLILKSRKPEAKAFKKWVTVEVLPSIRKHGAYVAGAEGLSLEGQTNLYAVVRESATEAMRRYDKVTEHDHWQPLHKRDALASYAAEKVAKAMGLPVNVVLSAGINGADVAVQSIVEGKV